MKIIMMKDQQNHTRGLVADTVLPFWNYEETSQQPARYSLLCKDAKPSVLHYLIAFIPAAICGIFGWHKKQLEPGEPGATTIAFTSKDSQTIPESVISEETAPEEAILCAHCRHEITSPRQRITVHGSHEHTFINPAGHIFHLGCYQDASGCLQRGELTTDHTWFQGYAWNYALCGQCFSHLGWVFHGGEASRFFGLISDKLIFS